MLQALNNKSDVSAGVCDYVKCSIWHGTVFPLCLHWHVTVRPLPLSSTNRNNSALWCVVQATYSHNAKYFPLSVN
jgi:hypothetical protein